MLSQALRKNLPQKAPSRGRPGGGCSRRRQCVGEDTVSVFPPSNLPPLGGGKESVYAPVDHNEGGSFQEIALGLCPQGEVPLRGNLFSSCPAR